MYVLYLYSRQLDEEKRQCFNIASKVVVAFCKEWHNMQLNSGIYMIAKSPDLPFIMTQNV